MGLKTEWSKPGTGRTVGELRRWVGWAGPLHREDHRPTSLDIVRTGPPEEHDIERVKVAIEQVEVEETNTRAVVIVSDDLSGDFNVLREAKGRTAIERAHRALVDAKAAVVRVDDAKLKWAEAQVDSEQAIRLMDYCLARKTRDKFEEARKVWHGAKATEMAAWAKWQACR